MPAVLAARVVPLFRDEWQRLIEVDRLRQRGVPSRRSLHTLRRTTGLLPLWFVLVVERADLLATALSLRGYRPGAPRSFARSFRIDATDWAVMGAVLGAAVFLWPTR
jgi:energy-coupling factor transporter transmembrane protein EcfT